MSKNKPSPSNTSQPELARRRRLYGFTAVYPSQPLFQKLADGHKEIIEFQHLLPKDHQHREGVWSIEIVFTPLP